VKGSARQTPPRRARAASPTEQGRNPLRELQKFGQSFWLDYIRRHMITSGELQRPNVSGAWCGSIWGRTSLVA
jgi:hypothetical protein